MEGKERKTEKGKNNINVEETNRTDEFIISVC